MTKHTSSIIAALTLVVALSPISIAASPGETNCRIPFGFTINGWAMPAGSYTVSTQGSALVFRGTQASAVVLTIPRASAKHEDPQLVFDKYGDSYTLREVWMGGTVGHAFPRARGDRNRRDVAVNEPVERVVVPLL